jgi:hypothetical protein
MVKSWTQEVGDARSVIEPIIKEIDSTALTKFDTGEGFRNDTVVVTIEKEARKLSCVVTFEAWANARNDPAELRQSFKRVLNDLDAGTASSGYILTSRGLTAEPTVTDREHLRDIAAGEEADVLAAQTLKRRSS